MHTEVEKKSEEMFADEAEKMNNRRAMKRNAEIRAQEIIAEASAHPERLKEGMIVIELTDQEWDMVREDSGKGIKYIKSFETQVVVNRLYEAGLNPQTVLAPHNSGYFAIKIHR